MYRWVSGTRAGGLGPKYGAAAEVLARFSRRNARIVPEVVLSWVWVVEGVRPVCIQWRRVLVCGGLLVGMSRSIMITAYEVPLSRVRVPMRGSVAVTGEEGV